MIYWVAGIEALIVGAWIGSFASAVGTPHQVWYVEVPVGFLILPVISTIISAWISKARDGLRGGVGATLGLLLTCNLVAFGFYGAMSGGGI